MKVKQSNSMMSLSSSVRKNRKYHKASNHFKNTTSKLNKEMVNTESFYNNSFCNNTSGSKGFKAGTLLSSTKKSTNDNWYK